MLFRWGILMKNSLDIVCYARLAQRHALPWIYAFIEGLKRHGIQSKWDYTEHYKPCDLAVVWGLRNKKINEGQLDHSADYLVMERGYFGDRKKFTGIGYNGLNGRAFFFAKNMPSDRWEKHWVEVKPWQMEGEYFLLMGQVSGDQSLYGKDPRHWYEKTMNKIKAMTGIPVYFRPHPLTRQYDGLLQCDGLMTDSLEAAFSKAMCAITYNSNSGVDAVLNGVPVVAMDIGSMAWDMARHDVSMNFNRPKRKQWLYDLAYKQWTLEEVENGDAWEHLKQRYA